MMRNFLLPAAVLGTSAIALGTAFADDHPLFRPTWDVAVEYRSVGNQADKTITMRFSGSRMRIDGGAGHGYAIVDTKVGRMIMVMTERQMYIERPADPDMVAMLQPSNASFKKTGSDTVAGVSCTTYDTVMAEHRGQVCLTSDGVMLRAHSTDQEHGHDLEATKVTYGEQPAALFEPPSGYQKMEMPDAAGMGRRPPNGVQGGPPGR